MDYGSLRRLTDEDLAAVIVYLRSLPPIHNPLPQTILSLDEQARLASRLSPLTGPVPERDLSDPVERGRYLVLVGSCVGCHTSWYSSRNPGLLGGGNIIERGEQKYFSTNITAHPSGMPYNAEAFINVIRTGKGGTLGPAMPWWTFQHMTDEDLGAIHAFMQTMNPIAHYINNFVEPTWCAVCGQEHGLGDRNRIEMPTSVAVDLALFDDYVGAYRSEEYGFTIRVRREGDHLRAQEDEGPVVDLIPQSDTRFLMPGGIAPLRFVRDEDGQAVFLGAIHAFIQTMNPIAHYINNFVEPTWCAVCGQEHGLGDRNRIEMPTSVAVDLALFDDYVGAYRSEEYGFTIRVRREGDHLRAQEDEGPVVDLIPQSDTRFLMPGGIAPLRFVRDEDGQVTRLVSEEVEEIVLQRIE